MREVSHRERGLQLPQLCEVGAFYIF